MTALPNQISTDLEPLDSAAKSAQSTESEEYVGAFLVAQH